MVWRIFKRAYILYEHRASGSSILIPLSHIWLKSSEQRCPDRSRSRAELQAMAQPHASSRWELSAPMQPRQLGNPALAGVPGKPRCEHCSMFLDNGRCVEPECLGLQPPPLMDESDDESDVAAAPRPSLPERTASTQTTLPRTRPSASSAETSCRSRPWNPARLPPSCPAPRTSHPPPRAVPRARRAPTLLFLWQHRPFTPRPSPQTRQRCGAGPSSL